MNTYAPLIEPICSAYPLLDASDLVFAPAPNLEVGDVALRTFEAAKKLRTPPNELANDIARRVTFGPEVKAVSPAGPYLNFRLDRSVFGRAIVETILRENEQYGSNRSGAGKRALVEHTSINPNASPHVGRARNSMIGDSLVRLLRFEGYRVEAHYYVNDMGRQIALLVMACEENPAASFDDMLHRYVEANARAQEDEQFARRGYELLARMEERDPGTQHKFYDVTERCLQGQLAVMKRLGVEFDVFDRESKYVKDERIERVLEALRVRDGVFSDEEDRLVVDMSKLGHTQEEGRYFVLMRANGSSMYGYRDIAYTIDKMSRAADLNLIVLGEDHKLYFQQITLILKAAGIDAPEPVYYAYILLKDGKMSTRQGNVVLLSDFLNEATARAAEKVEEQCRDLPPEERRLIAEKVGVGAARFAILRVSPNKNVIFDWESSLSFTGDTGPYVQYSCARIASILRKAGDLPAGVASEFPVETSAEWALLTKLAAFPDAVAAAVKQRGCAVIAQFALDAAKQFTSFYHDCPVLNAASEAQRLARAHVCRATLITLRNALNLLGIEALERM